MKANNSFRTEEEAVSPVIGVILMVAITVVLAAVVFVLVSDLGDTKDSAPVISFNKDGDRLRVISADDEAMWDDITATITGTSCTAELTTADSSGVTTFPEESVDAGDYLEISGTDCELTLVHNPTNQLYDTWTFA